jgi:oligopeptide/dipeptide ABC transporter ATP-binding protein
MQALAQAAEDREAASGGALLEVADLIKDFSIRGSGLLGRRARLRAVGGVSFAIAPGETLGIVGESGCGKSTLGRLVLRLLEPTSGTIRFDGRDISALSEPAMRPLRRDLQVVFQDPFSSLNPRLKVRDIIAEPLENVGVGRRQTTQRVGEVLDLVGLGAEVMDRYPHAFSGGQRQRIGIARALALRPRLLICDEAVSALDVSVQAQILNLLLDLQRELGLALLFISHNLAVVRYVSARIAVMYLGKFVEVADQEDLFERPQHPYTQALIAAVPEPDPALRMRRTVPRGDIPSPIDPPAGCAFHPRCPRARERCRQEPPELARSAIGGLVRCYFPG